MDTSHPTTSGEPSIRLVKSAEGGLSVPHRNRLGVLGGAYNPITTAHLAMTDTVVQTFDLHEVLLLLPQVPPHKSIFGASLEQRLDMMCLAVSDRPYAAVGLSTHGLFMDIYEAMQAIYPEPAEVFFITGRDAAERILTWDYDDTEVALQRMFAAFQFIVCDREGAFQLPDDPLLRPYADRIHRCAFPPQFNHVSSTTVRQHCRQGRALDGLVPPAVAQYIQDRALYRDAESC